MVPDARDPFHDIEAFLDDTWQASNEAIRPPLDAWRAEGAVHLELELPGVTGDIELTVEDHVLTVRARRAPEPFVADETLAHERPRGTFVRRIRLDDRLDAPNLETTYEAGVLHLVFPVLEEPSDGRAIDIRPLDDHGPNVRND